MSDLILFCADRDAKALPPGDCLVTTMREATAATASPPSGRLWFNILRPPTLQSPVYYLTRGPRRFASNCTLAYLHAKARSAFFYQISGEEILVPALPPTRTLQVAELQILEWVQTIWPGDLFMSLENASAPVLGLRHQHLAILRAHLTTMRMQQSSESGILQKLEDQITNQLRLEHSAFL